MEEIQMPKKADYSNTQKFSNRRSFDGSPVTPGNVLVPFRTEIYGLEESDYIEENFTTMHLGEFKFRLGFMPIAEEKFASYMKDFWEDINTELTTRREGRCIIGQNPDGAPILCPKSQHCTGCEKKGTLPRYNPNRVDNLSLDYAIDENGSVPEALIQPSFEDAVLNRLEPDPTMYELWDKALEHFSNVNPRYAEILKLSSHHMTIDEICIQIKLKPSRGRQEINSAHDALCDFLKLPHHKKNRK
jgi:hypothetical protein